MTGGCNSIHNHMEVQSMFSFKKPDRIDKNESDGQTFYGYDQKDGTTDWYTKDGQLDSSTKTPKNDD